MNCAKCTKPNSNKKNESPLMKRWECCKCHTPVWLCQTENIDTRSNLTKNEQNSPNQDHPHY